MATIPSSSFDATHSSNSSDDEPASSTTKYWHVTDDAAFSYRDGHLSWGNDISQTRRDEDIITVTKSKSRFAAYKIFSLAPTDIGTADEAAKKPSPFKLIITHVPANLPQEFLEKHLLKELPEHLRPENEIHVLVSTLSGTGLSPSFFDEMLQPVLRGLGFKDGTYNVVRTKSAESVKEFARSTLLVDGNEGRKQTVLMLSGDGGMVDTINGLLESGQRSSSYTKPNLSQFPLGTGNALFHSLHKPSASALLSMYIQGLRTLLHGKPSPLPIFRAKFSPGARLLTNEAQTATPLTNNTLYGAVVASYGLHATLVADSDTKEYRTHGDKRFDLVAKDLLFPEDGSSPHAYKADVTLSKSEEPKKRTEEVVSRKEHGYVLMSLVSNLEKAFTISPASKPLDAQLRVVHFGPLGGEGTMDIMKGAYENGKHVEMKEVGYESVDGVRIDFRETGESWKWRRCCVDGLIVGVGEGGFMDVEVVEKGNEAVSVVIDQV